MNKMFAILVLGLVMTSIAGLAIAEDNKRTIVNGHLFEADGTTPVAGATVTVTCNNNQLTDVTDANGYYVVEFYEGCPVGSTVTVSSPGGEDKGTVGASKVLKKNLVYINFSVPEFTVVGASLALVGAVVAFGVFRKRH